MNLRLEQIAHSIRMLRKRLGRVESHALIRDALMNVKARHYARMAKLSYAIKHLKEEKAALRQRLNLGLFVLGQEGKTI